MKTRDTATPAEKNVYTEVVAHNLCVGCGICAGCCPRDNLTIMPNEFGENTPDNTKATCAETCDLCLRSCPFWCEQAQNEDTIGQAEFGDIPGMQHRPETGYYLGMMLGYSNVHGHRENGASGGLATWTLGALLAEKMVDKVCCVRPEGEPGSLFKFVVCGSPEEVRRCSGSAYYPVEASEIVRHILDHDGRYAVIGLPCVVKAFRLAMKSHSKLKQRVRFLLGLVCGQGKSRFFAEYICALAGGDPDTLSEICFRVKDPDRKPYDHGVRFRSGGQADDEHRGLIFMSDGPGGAWPDRCFTPNACNFCGDTFAETADATFMDAWLPAFADEHRGTSIVIARNAAILEVIRQGAEQELSLHDVDADDVVASQRGVVHSKRNIIHERLRLAEAAGRRAPEKRPPLSSRGLPALEKKLADVTLQMSLESREAWPASGKDVEKFKQAMVPLATRAAKIRRNQKVLQDPLAMPRAALRAVLGMLGR